MSQCCFDFEERPSAQFIYKDETKPAGYNNRHAVGAGYTVMSLMAESFIVVVVCTESENFMIALQIIDIKNFMANLFVRETFDAFLMQHTRVLTASELVMQGRRSKDWYDEDEWLEIVEHFDDSWMTWGESKKTVFDYIKGSRTPQSMQLDFCVGRTQSRRILAESSVKGDFGHMLPVFHLQIRYKRGELMLVTAVSFSEFTMDKTAEHIWDAACCQFLERKNITFHLLNEE